MSDDPPLNKSPEATRLRMVATEWGAEVDKAPTKQNDAWARIKNRDLLQAALAYANAVYRAQPIIRHEDPPPKKKPIHAHPSGLSLEQGTPARWECTVCGRDKFTKRTPHKCVGGYRKKNLKWRPIYDAPMPANPDETLPNPT